MEMTLYFFYNHSLVVSRKPIITASSSWHSIFDEAYCLISAWVWGAVGIDRLHSFKAQKPIKRWQEKSTDSSTDCFYAFKAHQALFYSCV